MVAAHEIPFWCYCLFEFVLTRFSLLQSRKIKGGVVPSKELVSKSYAQIILAHAIQLPVVYFAFDLFKLRGLNMDTSLWPSWFEVAWQFAFFMVVCDTLLYWFHRMLHLPMFYARFHKQHHEFKAPIPVSSEYFSFFEEVGTGFIPTLGGAIFLGHRVHIITLVLWIAFRISESSEAHLGYDLGYWSVFSLGRPANRHFLHHSVNTGNFGAFFTFWDKVCGTEIKGKANGRNQQHDSTSRKSEIQ